MYLLKATGINIGPKQLGNKGGVAACCSIFETTFAFVATHLPARSERIKERRDDYCQVKIVFNILIKFSIAKYGQYVLYYM